MTSQDPRLCVEGVALSLGVNKGLGSGFNV